MIFFSRLQGYSISYCQYDRLYLKTSSLLHSDLYRFGHPSYDPIWTLAMSIMLIFLILVAIATTIDAYTVCFAMPDGLEESEIKNSKPEIIEKPSRPSVEPSTSSKSDIHTEIAVHGC